MLRWSTESSCYFIRSLDLKFCPTDDSQWSAVFGGLGWVVMEDRRGQETSPTYFNKQGSRDLEIPPTGFQRVHCEPSRIGNLLIC